ncbi:MAG: SH3 domain-containing protein [Clostridiales bacterium]|nr:SH3 domain-containing protein [Clostridiales bacterium]
MMKRILAWVMALALLITAVPALADGTADDAVVWGVVRNYTKQAVRVKMYSDADVNSDLVCEVYSGVFVRILEEKDSFVKVELGQAPAQVLTGYIPGANIDKTQGELTVQTPVLTVRNTAGGTGITLRSLPSNQESIAYGVVPNGSQVLLLAVVPDQSWYLVQSGGMVAYAARYGFSWYTENDQSNTAEQPDEDKQEHAFYGPSGNYVTGDWAYMTPDNVAVVNNPKQAERLHLRKEASYSAESLGRYYNGTRVEVLEKGQDWTFVRIGILEGYMRTEYLDFEYPFPVSGMPVMEIYNPGVLANMKLRLEPNMEAAYDGVYKNGTKVLMIGFAPGWAHVIVDGKMGFMRTEFLK